MKNLSLAFFLTLAAASLAASAAPTGNAEAGKAKSTTCAACHGEDGNSKTGEFPRLAGQHADYLYNALTHYSAGKRKNPIMAGMAAALKPQDMADLAAYFSSQKGLEVKY
jgi:cytochrome c553